jgi:hypothetical protein
MAFNPLINPSPRNAHTPCPDPDHQTTSHRTGETHVLPVCKCLWALFGWRASPRLLRLNALVISEQASAISDCSPCTRSASVRKLMRRHSMPPRKPPSVRRDASIVPTARFRCLSRIDRRAKPPLRALAIYCLIQTRMPAKSLAPYPKLQFHALQSCRTSCASGSVYTVGRSSTSSYYTIRSKKSLLSKTGQCA